MVPWLKNEMALSSGVGKWKNSPCLLAKNANSLTEIAFQKYITTKDYVFFIFK
jgi:hypothetical protein